MNKSKIIEFEACISAVDVNRLINLCDMSMFEDMLEILENYKQHKIVEEEYNRVAVLLQAFNDGKIATCLELQKNLILWEML